MKVKVNCKHNNEGAWCTNKKVKRSLFDLGARCCSDYANKHCCFKEARARRPCVPPRPPLSRVIREGVGVFCKECGSTMPRSGFLMLIGKRYCDNKKCLNSKTKHNKN